MVGLFKLRQIFLEKMINFYGPFLGSGIKLEKMSKDYRHGRVSMKLTFYNRNYMGTQFGGSLYAMIDPWYMLMLIKNLGSGHIVWDKGATIHFKRPGKGKVHAEFNLTDIHLEEIKRKLETEKKIDYIFKVEIKDDAGKLIADVEKLIYIRKKD
jgi:hypothetical protein